MRLLDSKIYHLKNGLTVVLCPHKNFRAVSFKLSIKDGSRYENSKNNGLAHLTEHLVYNFLKQKIEKEKVVRNYLINNLSAYTNVDKVNYEIEAHQKDINYVLDLLMSIFSFQLKDNSWQKEKKIIKEEILDEQRGTEYNFITFVRKKLYAEHNLGFNILGNNENLSSFTKKDILGHVKNFYNLNNAVLTMAGGFEIKKVIAYLNKEKKYFSANELSKNDYTEFVIKPGKVAFLPAKKAQILYGHYFLLPILGIETVIKNDFLVSFLRHYLVEKIRQGILCYNINISVRTYQDFFCLGMEATFEKDKLLKFYSLLKRELINFEKNINEKKWQDYKKNYLIILDLDNDYPKVIARESSWQYLMFNKTLSQKKVENLISFFGVKEAKKMVKRLFNNFSETILVTGEIGNDKEKIKLIFNKENQV